jgi:hypothetical protein
VKTGWSNFNTNLTESSKKGNGLKRTVLPMVVAVAVAVAAAATKYHFLPCARVCKAKSHSCNRPWMRVCVYREMIRFCSLHQN